ncbi:MAG: ribonuclease Z [Lachnospiraceae bacterium]|nr:ribonuclease Z [Lachnospiraceae bacterium]
MLDVCLLGTGGMMPLPRRWLTSLMLRYNGSSLLTDCGEGTQIAINKHGWSFKPIDTICFTHYHADHISGLPGILLAMANSDRTEPLLLIGPKGIDRVVRGLTVITPELPFEIRTMELTEPEVRFEVQGINVTAFKVNHRMACYGYSYEIKRTGKFDAERAKAEDIPLQFWSRLQKGETITDGGRTFTPDMVLGPDRKGIKVTYTTDTRPTESIAVNAKGSDLFICEGMYGEEDKYANAVENRHMMMSEAAKLAADAGVPEMWLTHYSPSMTHPENHLDDLKKIFPGTVIGKDGMSAELNFEED